MWSKIILMTLYCKCHVLCPEIFCHKLTRAHCKSTAYIQAGELFAQMAAHQKGSISSPRTMERILYSPMLWLPTHMLECLTMLLLLPISSPHHPPPHQKIARKNYDNQESMLTQTDNGRSQMLHTKSTLLKKKRRKKNYTFKKNIQGVQTRKSTCWF